MFNKHVIEQEVWEHEGIEYNVKIVVDEYPDLSYLGEYTDRFNWNTKGLIIDREANSDKGRNEFQYFECARDLESEQAWLSAHGHSKHESWLLPRQYARQAYKRYEEFNRGSWCMAGVIVTRESDTCADCGQEIEHAASLWSVESDYSEEYLKEIVENLIAEL